MEGNYDALQQDVHAATHGLVSLDTLCEQLANEREWARAERKSRYNYREACLHPGHPMRISVQGRIAIACNGYRVWNLSNLTRNLNIINLITQRRNS